LATINPVHAPHAKNGEQPWQSFSLGDDLNGAFFATVFLMPQSLSAQQGFAVSSSTIIADR
jgi:hypothetical protein